MDPEQLVAQLAELRTHNQQLHQALQQVQQQQSQQQGLVQALSHLPQSLAQTVGAAVLAAASPARANPTLVDTKGLEKPPSLKNTESEFVSLGTTRGELRRERTPWSERRLDVDRGKRFGNGVGSERSNGSCDASGHSANAGRPTVYSADDPCGRRIVRHPCGLWIWKKVWKPGGVDTNAGSHLTTGRARGLLRKIFFLDVPSWSSCKEQWNDWRT